MYLTIDVGGTKTLLAVFSTDGVVVNQLKFPTPESYEDFMNLLKSGIIDVCKGEHPVACALGVPAALDRKNGIAEHFGNLDWANVPVETDLKEILDCPIYLENDAKLAGLAEAESVQELYNRVLYVTVSTGIGLGLVVDGKIDYSVHDASGRAIMLEHNGKIMPWGEFASGKAIVRQTGKMASEITDEKDWDIIAKNLAIGLIDLTVTLTPDCIIIGGGVGAHLQKFHGKLHDDLEIYRSKMLEKLPQILQAKHPEEAVIYGGYLLCKQHES